MVDTFRMLRNERMGLECNVLRQPSVVVSCGSQTGRFPSLLACGRALCGNGVGFHILVEHFFVIKVRFAGWQEDEANSRRAWIS